MHGRGYADGQNNRTSENPKRKMRKQSPPMDKTVNLSGAVRLFEAGKRKRYSHLITLGGVPPERLLES